MVVFEVFIGLLELSVAGLIAITKAALRYRANKRSPESHALVEDAPPKTGTAA